MAFSNDVQDAIRNIPNAFLLATNTVKDEMQKTKQTTATKTNKRHNTTIQSEEQKKPFSNSINDFNCQGKSTHQFDVEWR